VLPLEEGSGRRKLTGGSVQGGPENWETCLAVEPGRTTAEGEQRMKHIKPVSKASVEDVTAALQGCMTSVLEALGLDQVAALLKKEDGETT